MVGSQANISSVQNVHLIVQDVLCQVRGVRLRVGLNLTAKGQQPMSTIEELRGIREELCDMLASCEVPKPEPLWQLTDYCMTLQSFIDIDFRLMSLRRGS